MQVAHRALEYAFVLPVGIVQAPVAAHRAFADALPRLVEGFDQVVVPAIGLGHGDETADEACLVGPAGHSGFALAAFAGPASLADEDILGRKARTEHPAHIGDMRQGIVDTARVVLPVGQQVNGQEVHRWRHLRVL
ncbi:hypothetical protein D3C79_786390 [compost metagenome]